jgi:alpha,alpha-trehalose-phosphate synthase [UDP-forming]
MSRRTREGRLVVLSNRGPFTTAVVRHRVVVRRSAGGLVAALEPVLRGAGGLWIAADDRPNDRRRPPPLPHDPDLTVRLVPLPEKEMSNYYHGFSNRVLWPICHGFLDKCRFDPVYHRDYRRANLAFAAAALREAAPRDLLWVHDYHLALVPAMIRAESPERRIALFWHIPFPPTSVLRAMPWAREILAGMLGSDLVGFHTEEYVRHFLESCRVLAGAETDERRGTVRLGRRSIRVIACPIGADVQSFEELARRQGVLLKAHRLRKDLNTERIILGVDRLDYTKGIPERLQAYERFLQKCPQYRRRQVLLQVAVPSRARVEEYRALKREIDETVGRINALYTDGGWVPIRYLYRSISRETLAVLYAAADVALITPLRDGMNLVAKEYLACQTRDDGVLIISDLAGAAEELEEALQVNPYDFDQVAEALHRAMEMTGKERGDRMRALRDRIRRHDVRWWVRSFLHEAGYAGALPAGARTPPREPRRSLDPAGWIEAEEPRSAARGATLP